MRSAALGPLKVARDDKKRASVEADAAVEAARTRAERGKARDFELADSLQAQILKMGVGVNDKRRTFFDSSIGWSYKS